MVNWLYPDSVHPRSPSQSLWETLPQQHSLSRSGRVPLPTMFSYVFPECLMGREAVVGVEITHSVDVPPTVYIYI